MNRIENLLAKYQIHRKWEEIRLDKHTIRSKEIENEPVYEFFQTLDESLDINVQPIAMSISPVESFIPFHYHNYVEISIVIKGRPIVEVLNSTIELEPWNIFIVGPNMIHKFYLPQKDDLVINISLKKSAFSYQELSSLQRSGSNNYIIDLLFQINELDLDEGIYAIVKTTEENDITLNIEQIIKEYYVNNDIQSSYIIRQELLVFFSKLSRLITQDKCSVDFKKKSQLRLLSFLLYIEQNYKNANLEEMGKYFGFNARYLSSYLKKKTGYSFMKLLHIQRVNVATNYLCYTNSSVEKIAFNVGYESPSYFYKMFKKILKQSPQEFREKYQIRK